MSFTLTALLTIHGEKYKILHICQEGFRPQRNITRQMPIITIVLEGEKLPYKDIYLTYTFGSIDYTRQLALMEYLDYPKDAIELISNSNTNSTTSIHGNHFGATPTTQISRGTIQGDTLNTYLFIIFLKPLLLVAGKKQPHIQFQHFHNHM